MNESVVNLESRSLDSNPGKIDGIEKLSQRFDVELIPDYFFRKDDSQLGLPLIKPEGAQCGYILVEKQTGRLWLAFKSNSGEISYCLMRMWHGIRQGKKGLTTLSKRGVLRPANYDEIYMASPSIALHYAEKATSRTLGKDADMFILEISPRRSIQKRTQVAGGLDFPRIGEAGTTPTYFISGYNEYLVNELSLEEIEGVCVITRGNLDKKRAYYESEYPRLPFRFYPSKSAFLKEATFVT